MKQAKIFWSVCAILLYCITAQAQFNAQNDLFNVLEGSCSNYLEVIGNDNIDSLQFDSLQMLVQPLNGVASVNGGYLSYCPTSGFVGADHFKYLLTASGQRDSAIVYVNVLSPNNLVFEGDADQNGKVENFDVLTLGLAYDLLGPSRSNSVSVTALAWSPSSFINTNPGAADCNGDGRVDTNDLTSIQNLYGNNVSTTNRYDVDTSVCTGNGIAFSIQAAAGDTVLDLTNLDIDINLGNSFLPSEAYGLAFTLEIDKRFVVDSAIQFTTSSSWLLQNDAGLFFKRSFQNTGEIEIAMTKTNHTSASGGGVLLHARLPIDDNIDGIVSAPGNHPLNIKLKKARLISEYNIVRELCVEQPSLNVFILPTGIHTLENSFTKIYPNPTSDKLFIEAEKIREVEITDVTGMKIYSSQTEPTNRISIDLTKFSLANGNYLVKIKAADFVSTQKIFVQH